MYMSLRDLWVIKSSSGRGLASIFKIVYVQQDDTDENGNQVVANLLEEAITNEDDPNEYGNAAEINGYENL